MEEFNLLQKIGQVSAGEATEIFRDHIRGAVRGMIADVMALEVEELCGPKHRPGVCGDTYRAGSSPGRVIQEGRREEVVRPRVRRREPDGSSSEALLVSYQSASDPEQLRASVVSALMAGVSTREARQVKPERRVLVNQMSRVTGKRSAANSSRICELWIFRTRTGLY